MMREAEAGHFAFLYCLNIVQSAFREGEGTCVLLAYEEPPERGKWRLCPSSRPSQKGVSPEQRNFTPRAFRDGFNSTCSILHCLRSGSTGISNDAVGIDK